MVLDDPEGGLPFIHSNFRFLPKCVEEHIRLALREPRHGPNKAHHEDQANRANERLESMRQT